MNKKHHGLIHSFPTIVGPVFLILFVMTSCATQKEIIEAPVRKAPVITEVVKSVMCKEDTSEIVNFSGIRVMPYLKLTFFDINDDGLTDMVIGGKKGNLHFYQNNGYPSIEHWERIDGYFDGVKAGAFSAPAVGDLNGDGRPEIVVGTGGFSSKSGRILVFENKGTSELPEWKEISGLHMDTGDDAAPAIADYSFDGKPDIIAGNSEGKIMFFRNESKGGEIRFRRDESRYINKRFDKYAVPSAMKLKNKIIVIVGTSMGKLYRIDIKKSSRKLSANKLTLDLSSQRFLSPSFTNLIDISRHDLVIADGDGNIHYFENAKGNYKVWKQNHDLFNNRLVAGPACAPTLASINGKTSIVVGNIDGTFKFYEFTDTNSGFPWMEKEQFLSKIKVSGFSRGVLTQWSGREMLITGESSGTIRAFINIGSESNPVWKEKEDFFSGIKSAYHSTPVTFDLDNDGNWELITGSENGKISAYRIKTKDDDNPEWEIIPGVFDKIRVRGFSSPAFVRYNGSLYLFAGQENGEIKIFWAALSTRDKLSDNSFKSLRFRKAIFINKIKMNSHSSPSVRMKNGHIELISGDYDGNIRHFVCNERQ
jgi:hypothetical protein